MDSTQPRAEQLDAFVRGAQSLIGTGGAYFTAEQRCMVANEAASCLGCALCAGLDAECTSEDTCAPIVSDLAKALEKADDFCTCGQADDSGFAMFSTSEGNQICAGIPKEVQAALKKKTLPQRFDALFALTNGLKSHHF